MTHPLRLALSIGRLVWHHKTQETFHFGVWRVNKRLFWDVLSVSSWSNCSWLLRNMIFPGRKWLCNWYRQEDVTWNFLAGKPVRNGRRSHEDSVLFGGYTVWPINNGGFTWFNKVYLGLIILNHSRDGHIVCYWFSLVFLVFNLWGFVGRHSFQSIHDNGNSIINMLVEWQKQSIIKPFFWVAKNSYHQLSISRGHFSLPSEDIEVSWNMTPRTSKSFIYRWIFHANQPATLGFWGSQNVLGNLAEDSWNSWDPRVGRRRGCFLGSSMNQPWRPQWTYASSWRFLSPKQILFRVFIARFSGTENVTYLRSIRIDTYTKNTI